MVNQASTDTDPAFTVFLAYLGGRSVREQTIADYRRQLQATEQRAAHLRVLLHALVIQQALDQPPVPPPALLVSKWSRAGHARAVALSPARRQAIAQIAAHARWDQRRNQS